ncbi:transporter substrate-binding domain-containing protein [Herbaspirillum sp. WKF16]|jgi:polar amino acid transport system substrate-binding protein|uniref:transporter substrate-binding domain-containing protein n=1 Tax=Herbaspirillum sp. WKF16 TaxID=3028312 RepID=UPI0023A9D774|nr:transporter substrate-binding domain-containing protein [Herbaspirillum sp. WKF16]WDZ95973.1 transporter substrate-binding domain-containing protein [Herbaspirillum sp. WKF16]
MQLKKAFTRTCIAALMFGAFAHSAMADQLDDIKKAGKIRVAIAMGTPLFSYADDKLQPAGSDVDTAKQLAQDLGVQLEIVSVTNAARVPTLQANRADIVVADLSITPERQKVIDFSIPYAVISIIVGGPKNIQIKDYPDLAGKRIGLTRATVNDTLTTQQAKDAEIVRYEDDATLITSMVTGQVEVFSSTPSNLQEMQKKAPGKNLELKFEQKVFDLGIALNKNQPRLKDWIDNWVKTNMKNGKLNAMYKKHHGRDLPASVQNVQ